MDGNGEVTLRNANDDVDGGIVGHYVWYVTIIREELVSDIIKLIVLGFECWNIRDYTVQCSRSCPGVS